MKIELTAGISFAVEDNRPCLVLGRSKDIMELDGEAVEVSDVQWSEVMVESIVKQGIVNREVAGWVLVLCHWLWSVNSSR
jgi:hypothetical protein